MGCPIDEVMVYVEDGNGHARRAWDAAKHVQRREWPCGANSHAPRMRNEKCAMEEAWKKHVGTKEGV